MKWNQTGYPPYFRHRTLFYRPAYSSKSRCRTLVVSIIRAYAEVRRASSEPRITSAVSKRIESGSGSPSSAVTTIRLKIYADRKRYRNSEWCWSRRWKCPARDIGCANAGPQPLVNVDEVIGIECATSDLEVRYRASGIRMSLIILQRK
jgi:hypothetical protein